MVPGNPELGFEHPELEAAAETWGGNWWEFGGGGTPWNAIVYDAKYDQLLVGTGNGAPWPRKIRSPGGGDNLYLGGVIALDPHTGRMNWFYQMTPADNWDFNAAQDIALLDMEIDGEMRSVALQAPKNAFFYSARPGGRRTPARQPIRTPELGDAHRHGDGPAGGEPGHALGRGAAVGGTEQRRRP